MSYSEPYLDTIRSKYYFNFILNIGQAENFLIACRENN